MGTKIPISITGNLVADPELTISESGVAHTKLRVAVNQRIQGTDGTWRDGEPVFHNVSAFRALAENVANSLKKGDPVHVAGELEFRAYDKDGERRESRRIIAETIGPDLRFGITVYQRSAHPSPRPDTEAHADPQPSVTGLTSAPSYNVSTKSPVVVPPFGPSTGNEMSW
jgi:single-strand DNA-binding protein